MASTFKSEESSLTQKPSTSRKKHLKNNERFPRLFKEAVRVIEEVKSGGKSIKTALYNKKLPSQCIQKVSGITYGVFDNLELIDEIIQRSELLKKLPKLKMEAAEVMIHELIVKKNPLPGESKPVQMFQQYEADIRKAYDEYLEANADSVTPVEAIVKIPKYMRVNTLRFTVQQAVQILTNAGFQQVNVDPDVSRKGYREIMNQLNGKQFLLDFHFKDVLVFPHEQNVVTHFPLSHCYHMIIQDKASYIAAASLNPPSKSIVLDACAAPGMKTVHLSSIMFNTGKVFAVDRDAQRLASLRSVITETGVQNCQVVHKDFMTIDPTKHPYATVEYILLDPSCSGSGMVSRNRRQDSYSTDLERICKLSRLQITFLKHALSFPIVKRIVYSTCSVHEEENEYVVDEALKMFPGQFEVVKSLPDLAWRPRGSKNFVFGKLCIRASTNKNLTNGFFVATIDRCAIKGDSKVQI